MNTKMLEDTFFFVCFGMWILWEIVWSAHIVDVSNKPAETSNCSPISCKGRSEQNFTEKCETGIRV